MIKENPIHSKLLKDPLYGLCFSAVSAAVKRTSFSPLREEIASDVYLDVFAKGATTSQRELWWKCFWKAKRRFNFYIPKEIITSTSAPQKDGSYIDPEGGITGGIKWYEDKDLTPLENWVRRQILMGFSTGEIIKVSPMSVKACRIIVERVTFVTESRTLVGDRESDQLELYPSRFWEKGDLTSVSVATPSRRRDKSKGFNKNTEFKGLYFDKKSGKWCARSCINGKFFYIGRSLEKEDAATMYNFWAWNAFGSEAFMNTVEQPWLEDD